MRSPQMMGVLPLHEGSGVSQTTFSVALQVAGRSVAWPTPLARGSHHWGQLSWAAAGSNTRAVRIDAIEMYRRIFTLLDKNKLR